MNHIALRPLRDQVKLAAKLEQAEHAANHRNREKTWLRQQAEVLGYDSDDELFKEVGLDWSRSFHWCHSEKKLFPPCVTGRFSLAGPCVRPGSPLICSFAPAPCSQLDNSDSEDENPAKRRERLRKEQEVNQIRQQLEALLVGSAHHLRLIGVRWNGNSCATSSASHPRGWSASCLARRADSGETYNTEPAGRSAGHRQEGQPARRPSGLRRLIVSTRPIETSTLHCG